MPRRCVLTSTSTSGADIQTELEDLVVSGDGVGENFSGIMTVAGTQTLVAPVVPASDLDSIRKAMTLIRINARTEPTAVVLNPTDAQTWICSRSTMSPTTSWARVPTVSELLVCGGVPVVETDRARRRYRARR